MRRISLISLLIYFCYFSSSDACDGNANEFIDEVLANARQDLSKWISLPDINSEKINLWNIYVWGFDSLRRAGNACFESDGQGIQTARATFEVFSVRGSARGSYTEVVKIFGRRIASIPFYFDVDARVPHIKLRLGITADLNARVVNIIDFHFEKFDDAKFSMKLNGFWKIFNFVANLLADRFGNRALKPNAKTLIYDSFANALKNFDKFDLIPEFD